MESSKRNAIMASIVSLDEKHSKVAARVARELGTTAEQYVHSLIDAANMTFHDILAPVQKGFRESGVTEEELNDAVTKARKAIYAKNHKGRK
jgi:hypothetical protein